LSRNIDYRKSVGAVAPDAVERPLASVMENPESLVVGATLVRLDIKFEKQAVRRDALKLDNAAGCFGHGGEGANRRPVFIGGCFHCKLPHGQRLPLWRGAVKNDA